MPVENLVFRVIIYVCWGLFCLAWVVGALYNSRFAPRAERARDRYTAWIVGVVLVAVGQYLVPAPAWQSLTVDAAPLQILGAGLLLIATAFILWARATLGTMWTSSPVIKRDHQLRTSGPYAVTRHPIYTGLLGMLIGTALVNGLGVWLWYVLVGVVILKVKATSEERLLEDAFGAAYRDYRRRVSQLVPGTKGLAHIRL
jgi:protein-S-isoprenylcysteine O-methyltransferase Ste14